MALIIIAVFRSRIVESIILGSAVMDEYKFINPSAPPACVKAFSLPPAYPDQIQIQPPTLPQNWGEKGAEGRQDLDIAHPLKRVLLFHLHLCQNLLHSFVYIYVALNRCLNRMRSHHSDPCKVVSKNGARPEGAPTFKLSSLFPPKVRPELSSAPLCDRPSSNFGPEGSLVGIYGLPC